MAKKSASSKASAPVVKAPEVKTPGAGEYRALRAFAFKLERIERGATITLTAEQATALGDDTVVLMAPVRVQSDDQTDAGDGSDKEQGQDGAADEGAAGASTADGATGSEAANEDQTV